MRSAYANKNRFTLEVKFLNPTTGRKNKKIFDIAASDKEAAEQKAQKRIAAIVGKVIDYDLY